VIDSLSKDNAMNLGYVKQHAVGLMHTQIQLPTSHTSKEQLVIQANIM
jgi:hypothetical protein